MRFAVRGLAGVLVAIVAALLIVPALINWNGYRNDLTVQAARILGRPVEIRGDLSVALLPMPKVTATDAHLGNIEGADEADMLSLDALEVRIDWAPLLIGSIRVDSVKLVRPVLNIEVFDTGESNLTLKPNDDAAARPTSGAAALAVRGMRVTPKTNGSADLSIENFVVENGTITYRNALRGVDERISDLNGRLAFASLKGPMDASLRATVHGMPVALEISAGEIIQGRTAPFSLDAVITPGAVKAQFSGSLNGLDDALRLRGRLTAEGENLKEFAAALGLRPVSDMLRRPFGLQANMALAADSADITDLVVKLDNTQVQGRVNATFDNKTTVDATLTSARIDLDALTQSAAATAKPEPRAKGTAPAAPNTGPATALDLPKVARGISLEKLPGNLTANLAVAIDALIWRGTAIRQSRLDVSLANRELTVSQLSTLLPGNAEVATFGFVTEKDAQPQFDGTIEATGSDLRGTLDWLGVPTRGIADDRLRNASFNARLSARRDQISASEMRARFDGTQIDGAVTAHIDAHPSFGANVTIDKINLDAYMPAAGPADQPAAELQKPVPAQGATKSGASAPPPQSSFGPVASLSALSGFDANVRVRIGSAIYKTVPLNDVRLEAASANGTLDIRSASIADAAGVTASLSGAVSGLDGTEPGVRDLVFDVKGKSLVNLFRALDVKSPVAAEALGPVAGKLRFNGPLKAIEVVSDIQAMNGRTSLSGRIDSTQLLPRVSGRIELAYPDAARFVRGFGLDWRPRSVKGGIDLAANLSGSLFEIGLQDIAGSFAGVRVSGAGATRLPLLGHRPLVALNLKTGDLDFDSFLPARRVAALESAPTDAQARVQPASFRMPASARGNVVTTAAREVKDSAKTGVWSNEPLDLSALGAFDGSLTVKSDVLRFGGLTIVNADLDAELQNGLFDIRHLTGKTFGGDLVMDGGLLAGPQGGRFEARYALENANVGEADRSFGAKGASQGSVTVDGRLRGGGKSPAELIASLGGEGSLAFRGIDSSDGQGSMLAAVGSIAQSLERLGGLRGKLEPIPINLSGPYRVENGVVAFDELAFSSPVGDGALHGRADLPKWQIAATGDIRLAKDFVIGGSAAKPVPFGLDGALDAPRLKLDIAALPGGGIQIPLDKLKTKQGAAEVLKSFIPNRAPKREAPVVESLPPPGQAAPAAPSEAKGETKAELKADPKLDAKVGPRTDFRVVPQSAPPVAAKGETKADAKSTAPAATQSAAKPGERVEDILKDILKGTSR